MKTDTDITQVTRFMYFAYNFPIGWMEKVWADDEHLLNHFKDKWAGGIAKCGTHRFFDFYMNLDGKNKDKLVQWIDNNYKP
tara:strand:+ start:3263 stop:3505 length:243 start_codon:yes stop_codon:yes gene_type:complete